MSQTNDLGTNEEIIKRLQADKLRLQVENHNLRKNQPKDLDETKRDLFAELTSTIEEQRKRIEELETEKKGKCEHKDRSCQTNLDSLNMEILIRGAAMKRQLEREAHSRHQHEHENNTQAQRGHSRVVSQLHYPFVTLPRPVSTKQMKPDEKECLEGLIKLDGLMTVIHDKLIANSDNIVQ